MSKRNDNNVAHVFTGGFCEIRNSAASGSVFSLFSKIPKPNLYRGSCETILVYCNTSGMIVNERKRVFGKYFKYFYRTYLLTYGTYGYRRKCHLTLDDKLKKKFIRFRHCKRRVIRLHNNRITHVS